MDLDVTWKTIFCCMFAPQDKAVSLVSTTTIVSLTSGKLIFGVDNTFRMVVTFLKSIGVKSWSTEKYTVNLNWS